MKRTVAIALGCVALALAWASRSDNPSARVKKSPETISSKLMPTSSLWGQPVGMIRGGDKTMPPGVDESPSFPEESERDVSNEPVETMADRAETFWAFDAEPAAEPDAPEFDVTLDRFDRPYVMTMTEAGFAQLSPADKSVAIDEIVGSLRQARRDARDTCAQADADIACGDYGSAETTLVSEFQRLGDFNANEEGLYLTRIMGIHLQQTTLKQLETLYTRTGNNTRLQTTQRQWQDLEAQKRQMQAAQVEQAG